MQIKIKTAIFEEVINSLLEMEEKEEVDIRVVDKLKELIENLDSMEKYWAKTKDIPIKPAFIFYSAAHNSKLILEKMKGEFITAHEKMQNPRVVIDASTIFPALHEIYSRLVQGMSQLPQVNPILLNKMFELIRSTRELAKRANMLPSIHEELAGVDKKSIKEEFSKLDLRIGTKMWYGLE